jgi:hypothetical protein
MALVAAYTILKIKKEWLIVFVLFVGMLEGIANQQHDLFIKKNELYKLRLETIADSVCSKNDLIVINSGLQQLYFSHRKGWTSTNNQIEDGAFLQKISQKGCEYIFIDKHSFKKSLTFTKVYSDIDYDVYVMPSIGKPIQIK